LHIGLIDLLTESQIEKTFVGVALESFAMVLSKTPKNFKL